MASDNTFKLSNVMQATYQVERHSRVPKKDVAEGTTQGLDKCSTLDHARGTKAMTASFDGAAEDGFAEATPSADHSSQLPTSSPNAFFSTDVDSIVKASREQPDDIEKTADFPHQDIFAKKPVDLMP